MNFIVHIVHFVQNRINQGFFDGRKVDDVDDGQFLRPPKKSLNKAKVDEVDDVDAKFLP